MKDGLSKLQQLFADKYIETGNAGQSYIDAGYKAKNMSVAYSCASQLLRSPKVKSYIRGTMADKDNERIMSQDRVLELLTKHAEGLTDEEMVVAYQNKASWETAKRKVPPKEQIKALELLGKRYALFTEKQQIDSTVEQTTYVAKWGDDE